MKQCRGLIRNRSLIRIRYVPARLTGAIGAALFAVAIFAGAGGAQAASCPYDDAQKVFGPWGDYRNYELAPDGGFEAGAAGWNLSGSAGVVGGNESFYVHDAGDSRSLRLPGGSSATSPPICMSLDTPVFRLFARNSGDPSSRLRVEATYNLLGLLRTKVLSTITTGSAWAPTQPFSTVLTLSTVVGTLIPSSIKVLITPLDAKGRWQVDDLYVDPFSRR